MTIKEMEERSGLARANIRFYEAEGLITPQRRPNGYRDYSEEDLQTLLRVRLLRSLYISLEEIKDIQCGAYALTDVLDRHMDRLAAEQAGLARAQTVCREIKDNGTEYAALDAARYLEELEKEPETPTLELNTDVIPTVKAPWRRYFARNLDFALYGLAWDGVFLAAGLHGAIQGMGGMVVNTILSLLAMLFLEPVFLRFLGTTPGKWIFGLRVTDLDGHRLTYSAAANRTGNALVAGMGLEIPIYNIVRLVKSYSACEDGRGLVWEKDSQLILQDTKVWRPLAFLAAAILVVFGTFAVRQMAQLPRNRGDITVAQFCENFNTMANHMDYPSKQLKPDGTWRQWTDSDVFVLDDLFIARPDFVFTEADGKMTGLFFTLSASKEDIILSWGQEEMALAIWAFVGAQKDCGIFHDGLVDRYNSLVSGGIRSFEEDLYGVHIRCDADWEGYNSDIGVILAEDDALATASVTFSMEKQ